jgi:hypothetical protein
MAILSNACRVRTWKISCQYKPCKAEDFRLSHGDTGLYVPAVIHPSNPAKRRVGSWLVDDQKWPSPSRLVLDSSHSPYRGSSELSVGDRSPSHHSNRAGDP